MKTPNTSGRFSLGRIALSAALVAPVFGNGSPALAATAAGTQITNTATAAYSDGSNNTYSTNSNTVTTTVQGVPVVTVAAATGKTYEPGTTATDSFTLTNTGNGNGYFVVDQPTFAGGTSAPNPAAITSYGFNGANYTTLAALNTAIMSAETTTTIPTNGTIVVTATYTVPANATTSTNATPLTENVTLGAQIEYPSANNNGATAAESAAGVTGSTATAVDTVDEVRLDVQKNSQFDATIATDIDYSISVNNGSATYSAKDLASAQALLGASATKPGILITDKIPTQSATSTTPLTLDQSITVKGFTGAGYTGGTFQIYYTNDATGKTGWTALGAAAATTTTVSVTPPAAPAANPLAAAAFIGVYVYGTPNANGYELSPDFAGSTATAVSNPQIQLTFSVMSGGAGGSAVTNLANAVAGNDTPVESIVEPLAGGNGSAAPFPDSASPANLTSTGNGIENTVANEGPSGASNLNSIRVSKTAGVLNGPLGAPGATGNYAGGTADTTNDFTNGTIVTTTGNKSVNTTPAGGTLSTSTLGTTGTASVTNSVQNTGNAQDTYTLTFPTLPAGVTVTSVTSPAGTVIVNTPGASYTLPVVGVGTTINYTVNYAAAATVPTLTQEDVAIVATGTGGANDANTTHNELYAGFLLLTKSATVANPASCPNAASTTTACSGATITYVVDYKNVAAVPNGTEPATATQATIASGFTITEDGTAGSNNWAANTGGLVAAPTDSSSTKTPNNTPLTYAFFTNGTGSATHAAAGAQSFTATIPTPAGKSFGPGFEAAITFQVVVK